MVPAIVSKADAVTFSAAFARYLEYLTAKAAKKGKPDRWRYNVEKLGKIVLPQWGSWTLADMAKRPDIVADWYSGLHKKTPASAGHCGRIIRAIYNREAKRDIHLPARLPTKAIEFDGYQPSQVSTPTIQPTLLALFLVGHAFAQMLAVSWAIYEHSSTRVKTKASV
jgi:hypothetical protein